MSYNKATRRVPGRSMHPPAGVQPEPAQIEPQIACFVRNGCARPITWRHCTGRSKNRCVNMGPIPCDKIANIGRFFLMSRRRTLYKRGVIPYATVPPSGRWCRESARVSQWVERRQYLGGARPACSGAIDCVHLLQVRRPTLRKEVIERILLSSLSCNRKGGGLDTTRGKDASGGRKERNRVLQVIGGSVRACCLSTMKWRSTEGGRSCSRSLHGSHLSWWP